MPIGGHPSGIERGFGLKVCPPCRAGDHGNCRPFVQHARQRLLYCECLGWRRAIGHLIVLPCLAKEPP